MIPKDVICLKDGVTSLNDYQWDTEDIAEYILFGLKKSPEWDANRARGLEKLIELVKTNPDEWSQFNVTYNDSIKRDVLDIVEKQNGIRYGFYVDYEEWHKKYNVGGERSAEASSLQIMWLDICDDPPTLFMKGEL